MEIKSTRYRGIMAIFTGPNLSRPAPGHKFYPYLLRGVVIERVNVNSKKFHSGYIAICNPEDRHCVGKCCFGRSVAGDASDYFMV